MNETPRIRPRALRIEASSACQLRCPDCMTTQKLIHPAVGTGWLRADDLRRLLDECPGIADLELSNFGEIFLNPQLLDVLELCHARGVRTHADNGVNLNDVRPELLEGIVQHGLRRLRVSIDGATQETYVRYRRRGTLDQVLANVAAINAHKRRLGSRFPVLTWQFIVFGHNEHEIDAARARAAALDMLFSLKLSWNDDASPVRDRERVRALMPHRAATRGEFAERTGEDYMAGLCNQLWDAPAVNWDGRMLGCCKNHWRDFGGNVFTDGVYAAVNSERMDYARDMVRGRVPPRPDVACAQCDVFATMHATGRWLRRGDFAAGQDLSLPEALEEARTLLSVGRVQDAENLCRSILIVHPATPEAYELLSQAAKEPSS